MCQRKRARVRIHTHMNQQYEWTLTFINKRFATKARALIHTHNKCKHTPHREKERQRKRMAQPKYINRCRCVSMILRFIRVACQNLNWCSSGRVYIYCFFFFYHSFSASLNVWKWQQRRENEIEKEWNR